MANFLYKSNKIIMTCDEFSDFFSLTNGINHYCLVANGSNLIGQFLHYYLKYLIHDGCYSPKEKKPPPSRGRPYFNEILCSFCTL